MDSLARQNEGPSPGPLRVPYASFQQRKIVESPSQHSGNTRLSGFGRLTGNNRPKSPHPTMESLIKGLYFLSVGFSSGGGVPLPSMILAGRRRRRSPCEVRSTSSQFPSRRTRLQPTGPNTATRSSYADARFVNEILLWVTAVAASRLTTSITIGFGFIVGAASGAG